MNIRLRISLILSLLVILSSCYDYPCTSGQLQIGLIGFSDVEADTLIVRRFTKNTTQLKDSFLIDHIGFKRNLDTLELVATPGIVFSTIEFDYEFYFPATGNLFKLTNITEEQRYIEKRLGGTKEGCANSISGYTLNGIRISTIEFSKTYLKK